MYHSHGPPRPVSTPPTTRRREGALTGDTHEYDNHAYEYILDSHSRKRERSASRGRSLSRDPPGTANWATGNQGQYQHKRRHTSPKTSHRPRAHRNQDARRTDEQFANAKENAYNRGWSACLEKHKNTLESARADREEIYRLRDEIRAAHADLEDTRLALQQEQRRAREMERGAHAAQLRAKAQESRGQSRVNDDDVVMLDIAPAGRSTHDSQHAHKGKGRDNPEPRSTVYDHVRTCNNARTPIHALTNGSNLASTQKGREYTDTTAQTRAITANVTKCLARKTADMTRAATANVPTTDGAPHTTRTATANVAEGGNTTIKRTTLLAWTKMNRPRPAPITDLFVAVPLFDRIPQRFEELEQVCRKATRPHGAIAVYQLLQWKRTAEEKKECGFDISAADKWAIQWTVPAWFVQQHDDLRASRELHVMTPPAWQHPLIHWFRHFDANRKSMRKGIRRFADGRPDLYSIEGLYLAATISLHGESDRAVPDASIVDILAGLLVSPAAYAATLTRLKIEPEFDLHVAPYQGPRPASADDVCRHLARCGLTTWDVQQSLSEWASAFLASNEKPNRVAIEAAVQPVSPPTTTLTQELDTDVETPLSALALDEHQNPDHLHSIGLVVDPFNIPLPEGDDMDLDENALSDVGGNASPASA